MRKKGGHGLLSLARSHYNGQRLTGAQITHEPCTHQPASGHTQWQSHHGHAWEINAAACLQMTGEESRRRHQNLQLGPRLEPVALAGKDQGLMGDPLASKQTL